MASKGRNLPEVPPGKKSDKSKSHKNGHVKHRSSPDETEGRPSSGKDRKSRSSTDPDGKPHKHHHRQLPDVASESGHSTSRPSSGKSRRKHRTPTPATDDDDDTESVVTSKTSDTQSTSKSTKTPSKKTMLKYMIHEVRELKRQLDPNAQDIHIWQKREKSQRPKSASDVDTLSESFALDSDKHKSLGSLKEEAREVVEELGNGNFLVKKHYTKSETFRVKQSMSPDQKRRLLPSIPQDDSEEESMETDVPVLSQTFPPLGAESGAFRPIVPAAAGLASAAPIITKALHSPNKNITAEQLMYFLQK